MSDQKHDIDLFDFLEMLSTNEASVLSVGEVNYEIVYGKELPSADVPHQSFHKLTIANEVDGHEISGEAKSATIENALAGAINNYIKNILQDLVGYGVRESVDEGFVQKLGNSTSNGEEALGQEKEPIAPEAPTE